MQASALARADAPSQPVKALACEYFERLRGLDGHTRTAALATIVGMGLTFVTLWTFAGYMTSAAIIGAALAALERKFTWRPPPRLGVFALFATFACIDSYWLPLSYAVDLTCTMDVAPLNGPADIGPVSIPNLFTPDGWDAIAWIGQVVVATHVATWLGAATARA